MFLRGMAGMMGSRSMKKPNHFQKADRFYPKGVNLSVQELEGLSQVTYVDYLREKLWDKYAEEDGKVFDDLTADEQVDVDFRAILAIGAAMERVKREKVEG